jgi:hypothetical protein
VNISYNKISKTYVKNLLKKLCAYPCWLGIITHYAIFGCSLVFSCFDCFVSCGVSVKNRKKISFNSKHGRYKTTQQEQKMSLCVIVLELWVVTRFPLDLYKNISLKIIILTCKCFNKRYNSKNIFWWSLMKVSLFLAQRGADGNWIAGTVPTEVDGTIQTVSRSFAESM